MKKNIDINIVINMYKEGYSIRSIGSKLHIDQRRVRKVLLENNIKINKGGLKNNCLINKDNIIREYNNGASINSLICKYNTNYLTIKTMLDENHIHVRNLEETLVSKSVNINYFDVIDTEEKAYILGLAYADGSISFNRKIKTSYCFSIGFKEGDQYILDKIKKSMNSTHSITYIPSKKQGYKSNNGFYRLAITSKQIFNSLLKLGMKDKNSIPNIPNELLHHFIRGIFDGDGCISISSRGDIDMHIMGNENFLNELNKHIHFNKPTLVRNIYRIRKSGRLNAIKFSNYIYKDATIYLERKYNKFAVLSQKLQKTQDY